MQKTLIYSGNGNKIPASVTANGQLIVSPIEYDDTVYKELAVADTGYNFYVPKPGKQFVITGFIAKADKQVSTTVDADVIIYEATTATETTVVKTLFQTAMVEGDLITALPINIKVTEGRYINAKTTDDDIHMTIMGYYINT